MFISDEGLVAGSVNRAELAAAYEAATDEAVRANLAAAGAAHGMVVHGGKLVDPSVPAPAYLVGEEGSELLIEADTKDAVQDIENLSATAEAVSEPPRSGPGSGRDAWATYAETLGVEVTDDMTRDDIIAAIELAEEE